MKAASAGSGAEPGTASGGGEPGLLHLPAVYVVGPVALDPGVEEPALERPRHLGDEEVGSGHLLVGHHNRAAAASIPKCRRAGSQNLGYRRVGLVTMEFRSPTLLDPDARLPDVGHPVGLAPHGEIGERIGVDGDDVGVVPASSGPTGRLGADGRAARWRWRPRSACSGVIPASTR